MAFTFIAFYCHKYLNHFTYTLFLPTLACGEVIQRPHGHVTLESYPINAKCEWTLQVGQGATMELRYLLLKAN